MDYRERANIITVSEVDDGMGGIERKEVVAATIKCKVAPYTVRTVNSAGLPIEYSRNKLFTKDKTYVENIYSDYFIEYKGIKYKKISVMDAGKCLIVEMERVER